MKNIVFEIGMDYELEENGLVLDFTAGVKGKFNEVLTDDEFEAIKKATKEISKILNDAIIRDFKKEMKKKQKEDKHEEERLDKIDKLQKELYDLMSEETKKEIDEFNEKIDKLETDEEKAMFAFKKLLKVMKEMEGNDR